jgi:hypothetical protein
MQRRRIPSVSALRDNLDRLCALEDPDALLNAEGMLQMLFSGAAYRRAWLEAKRSDGTAQDVRDAAVLTAQALNDNLMIVLNCAAASIDRLGIDHPASALLLELQCAAERCAEGSADLLRIGEGAVSTQPRSARH